MVRMVFFSQVGHIKEKLHILINVIWARIFFFDGVELNSTSMMMMIKVSEWGAKGLPPSNKLMNTLSRGRVHALDSHSIYLSELVIDLNHCRVLRLI